MPESDGAKPKRRIFSGVGVAVTALVVAAFTAIGTGLGSKALDVFDGGGDEVLVSASARAEIAECGTQLFVERPRARAVLAAQPGGSWLGFMQRNRARVAAQSVVTVSIQGESARTVTLTGIRFHVVRRPRPAGAVFANPCGGGVSGRSVLADLDRQPVAIVNSNEDPRGALDPTQRPAHPIRFPWTCPSPIRCCSRSSRRRRTAPAPGEPRSPGSAAGSRACWASTTAAVATRSSGRGGCGRT